MMAMWHFDEKSRVIFIDQTEIIEHTHGPSWLAKRWWHSGKFSYIYLPFFYWSRIDLLQDQNDLLFFTHVQKNLIQPKDLDLRTGQRYFRYE